MKRFFIAVATLAVALAPASAQDRAHAPAGITVPPGFTVEVIANVPDARELAVAPNGDLFVGTLGSTVAQVPSAEGMPGTPHTFVTLDQQPVAGVAVRGEWLYLGAQFGVFRLPYHSGDRAARAKPEKIATVRPSGVARDHVTTTLAISGETLYAGVGSSCNTCVPELDATRATIQMMHLDGSGMTPRAIHIRNAIALAVNPATGTLWAGVAGQDELAHGHPYENFDAITLHPGVADYGWPYCYENRIAVGNRDCSSAAVPRAVFPAYATPIGATFYPENAHGRYAFPAKYRGAFVTLHGSWHQPPVPPRVVFVPMNGDEPRTAVNWSDPNAQWQEFVGGFQSADGARTARPTGVAVGPDGSLFVADDQAGNIYRIRPTSR